jgi:hypothetical protein
VPDELRSGVAGSSVSCAPPLARAVGERGHVALLAVLVEFAGQQLAAGHVDDARAAAMDALVLLDAAWAREGWAELAIELGVVLVATGDAHHAYAPLADAADLLAAREDAVGAGRAHLALGAALALLRERTRDELAMLAEIDVDAFDVAVSRSEGVSRTTR